MDTGKPQSRVGMHGGEDGQLIFYVAFDYKYTCLVQKVDS